MDRMVRATVSFEDLSDDDEVSVTVRRVEGGVGLSISKRSNGDLETFIPLWEAQKVAEALRDLTQ
jgi:hypothetical protein